MQRSEMGYRRGGTGGGRLSTRLWAGVSPGDVGGDAGRFGATCDDDSHVRIGDMRWRDIVACDRAAFFGEVAVRSRMAFCAHLRSRVGGCTWAELVRDDRCRQIGRTNRARAASS